ncbi:2-phospho-L-lactate guanylyltransferase [Novosphingobium sp. JCM 18896]|uniref:2-phospho-L-lactate guanylyltransferase n=1 Tax=Novosphingobium sp. JCM 18896 TaxID=2989731 RepID=UPI0022232355|nr:2-phospho-L-lactate guanylyltransferase [Novosphingobium sp. JCM 18896]MCW1431147.1 2-phospho-L-lactate guanylyltransferase [Novosphingobium sp. JCM 18896]
MTVWAIIPLRATPESKSRLAGVLDETARGALVEAMLARVLAAAQGARNVDEVRLIGSARSLPAEVTLMADPGQGLNAAAAAALDEADGQANRLIVIHGDLPLVTAQDIELLAAAPEGEIAIAPDRHGTGTNAISLPLPAARGFSFAFGIDSFALHNAEAGRMGLGISEVHSPGLSRDVDEPEDLSDAADLLKSAS